MSRMENTPVTLDDDKIIELVTALCDQPETFASDLSDAQSRYLLIIIERTKRQLGLVNLCRIYQY